MEIIKKKIGIFDRIIIIIKIYTLEINIFTLKIFILLFEKQNNKT